MASPTSPKSRSLIGLTFLLLTMIVVIGAVILPFTPFGKKAIRKVDTWIEKSRTERVVIQEKIKEVVREVEKKVEVIKEVKVPAQSEPLPSNFVPRKSIDVASLYNGITIETQLQTEKGKFATIERKDKDAFKVAFKVEVRVPEANQSLEELAKTSPELPKALPGLKEMMSTAKVSGFYHKLYDNKVKRVQTHLTRLDKILDRHNFFDCETILEMYHPVSKRKALLIQSEMDVVTDGSDGDRMPVMEASIYNSTYYQPFTSYAWRKEGKVVNPLLPKWQDRLTAYEKEFAVPGLSRQRNAELTESIRHAKATVNDLIARSSLIAETDPFIVLSLLFRGHGDSNPYTPAMGDYAAVIHEGKIYPAICGDYGPTFKMGEASLLMAKTINEKANSYSRPVSDLKVTYLVFPGTAERPFGPPDLAKWQQKVEEYLKECGGVGEGYTLHQWHTPPPPPPAPEVAADPATMPATPSSDPAAAAQPANSAAPANGATSTTPAAPGSTATSVTPTGPSSAIPVKPKTGS